MTTENKQLESAHNPGVHSTPSDWRRAGLGVVLSFEMERQIDDNKLRREIGYLQFGKLARRFIGLFIRQS